MRVLVPTDLSEAGLLVIEGLCASPAQPFERVVLLHVIELDLYTAGGSIPAIREWAGSELAEETRRLRERGFDASWRLEEGDAVETIERVAAEEEAGLVMVTSLGRNAAARRLFGSTAERLAAAGDVPVLVDRVVQEAQVWCRLGSGTPFARPLAAMDLEEEPERVPAVLASLPAVESARVVHVAEDARAAVAARERLDALVASHEAGAPWDAVVRRGDPVEGVLAEAEAFGATLLVVSPKVRGVERALRGSVSRRLAERSPVPVLFVPRPHPEAEA
ncbi:MAG: universal stress protein [Coriobacteriia bacterium]|nr:universal stress protein [Coriobacteriia bacterium]